MTDELHQTFAQLLRQARREAGLTQEELAERAGISPRAVSNLERGINRAPRRDTLELLFTALNLESEEQTRWERVRKRLSVRPESAISSVTASRSQGQRLPEPLTSFFGREEVLPRIQQMLTESRLVTLTGPGGVGKTRLGIAVAGLERHRRADGVFFVPLAHIGHPDLVIPAIVRALGIDETPACPRSKRLFSSCASDPFYSCSTTSNMSYPPRQG